MKNFALILSLFVTAVSFSQNGGQTDFTQGNNSKLRTMSKAEEEAHFNQVVDKATTCAGATAQAVALQDCSDVGTAAFLTTGTNAVVDNTGGASTVPTTANAGGCGSYTTVGQWLRFNPDPGVTSVDFQMQSGAMGKGSHNCYAQFFQGTGCPAGGTLTAVGPCQNFGGAVMGILWAGTLSVQDIDPSQDLWLYTWNDSGKAYQLNYEVIGSAGQANDNCASATTNANGCNLGAAPATFTAPSTALGSAACSGGTWYSNENTVFFQFTASATTGSIGVAGINCNQGVTGQAQFAVFNNCACVGTYTPACYKSCAVGSGTLSLAGLTPGATYIIAVDGQAGDACTWNFTTTGIILPVELINLSGSYLGYANKVSWKSASERNCASYIVERSTDGENFEFVDEVKGNGNSTVESYYEVLDYSFVPGDNYYRLTQVDIDGQKTYFAPILLTNKNQGVQISPNPVSDMSHVTFGVKNEGAVTLKVTDVAGKTVLSETFFANKGENNYNLGTSSLSKGAYNLVITSDTENRTIKFVK